MQTLRTTCVFCGKQLRPTRCETCKGTGKVSRSGSGLQTCDACKGQGQFMLCPDWVKHLNKKPLESRLPMMPKIVPTKSPRPVQRCNICGGAGGIRHPMTGQAGPCPRCKGRGTL